MDGESKNTLTMDAEPVLNCRTPVPLAAGIQIPDACSKIAAQPESSQGYQSSRHNNIGYFIY
jgi:hypothetical protein